MSEFEMEPSEIEDEQKNKYLIFAIEKESYGIGIQNVIEIISIEPITAIPEIADYLKGIINLRGRIIPIMDIRLRFKKEEKEYDDRTCIIVVQVENTSFGLIVDSVTEVINIEEKNISPPPKTGTNQEIGSKYIEGIGKINNEVTILLDCSMLLEDGIKEIVNLE